jgi:hypothetical protein
MRLSQALAFGVESMDIDEVPFKQLDFYPNAIVRFSVMQGLGYLYYFGSIVYLMAISVETQLSPGSVVRVGRDGSHGIDRP